MSDPRHSDPQPSLDRDPPAIEGDLRLPRPPGVIRQFWQRHPWLTDSLIAAAYALPALLATAFLARRSGDLPADVLIALCALASIAAVLFRRRAPLVTFAVALAATALVFSFSDVPLALGLCAVLYSIPVYDSNRNAWIALGCSVAVIAAAAVIPWPQTTYPHPGLGEVVSYSVLQLLAVLIGVTVGNRKRYLQALIDRAAQLAAERDQQARLATAAERARIAREMHDIVSHSLTVMITLADGSAAQLDSAPDLSREAMLHVAETGRHALTDMRRMLGVLGEASSGPAVDEPGLELAPQPAASDLGVLIDRFRAAGLPVRYTVTGRAPADAALQLTVYRIVQESLTNVLRHAPAAARVDARIRYGATVSVEVRNSQPPPASAGSAAIHGAGRGLIGLRERIALYGGSLEAGQTNDGWRVLAIMTAHEEEGQG
ncbi:MAG TPA: histidine kinase [Humibacter sp.]|nr:histidine kinase [Humibacter sp.]